MLKLEQFVDGVTSTRSSGWGIAIASSVKWRRPQFSWDELGSGRRAAPGVRKVSGSGFSRFSRGKLYRFQFTWYMFDLHVRCQLPWTSTIVPKGDVHRLNATINVNFVNRIAHFVLCLAGSWFIILNVGTEISISTSLFGYLDLLETHPFFSMFNPT